MGKVVEMSQGHPAPPKLISLRRGGQLVEFPAQRASYLRRMGDPPPQSNSLAGASAWPTNLDTGTPHDERSRGCRAHGPTDSSQKATASERRPGETVHFYLACANHFQRIPCARTTNEKSNKVTVQEADTSNDIGAQPALEHTVRDPEKEFSGREGKQLLVPAMGEFKPWMQAALRMCDIDEYSIRETALIVAVTVSALMPLLSRARRILRGDLKGSHPKYTRFDSGFGYRS